MDITHKTIAVFGETIGFAADIRSAGRDGFGIGASQDGLLGVAAVHHAAGNSRYYIPYAPEELENLGKLLSAFG